MVIPREKLEEARLREGDNVEFKINRKGRIELLPQVKLSKDKPRLSYDEVRVALFYMLERNPQGLTWTQIREKAPGFPIKPSPFWVQRLIPDIGLKRIDELGRRLWKIESRTTERGPSEIPER
jgi:hypothetical protein